MQLQNKCLNLKPGLAVVLIHLVECFGLFLFALRWDVVMVNLVN